jgi:hypothetical protein
VPSKLLYCTLTVPLGGFSLLGISVICAVE